MTGRKAGGPSLSPRPPPGGCGGAPEASPAPSARHRSPLPERSHGKGMKGRKQTLTRGLKSTRVSNTPREKEKHLATSKGCIVSGMTGASRPCAQRRIKHQVVIRKGRGAHLHLISITTSTWFECVTKVPLTCQQTGGGGDCYSMCLSLNKNMHL